MRGRACRTVSYTSRAVGWFFAARSTSSTARAFVLRVSSCILGCANSDNHSHLPKGIVRHSQMQCQASPGLSIPSKHLLKWMYLGRLFARFLAVRKDYLIELPACVFR